MCSGGLNIRYSLDSPVEKQVSWITHPDFREPPGRYAKSQLLAAPNARPAVEAARFWHGGGVEGGACEAEGQTKCFSWASGTYM